MKSLILSTVLILAATQGARAECELGDFRAPTGAPLVIETKNDPIFLDLKALLSIDENECAGRKIRYLRVYSGGDAYLYVRINGVRANSTAAEVDRKPEVSRADWLYMPESNYTIGENRGEFRLEVLSRDNDQPELRIYAIEVVENLQ